MRELVAELKCLRLHGMAARYEEILAEGGSAIQMAEWLIRALLDAEGTDRHVRSIRYQMSAARFPVHRDLAGFDFSKSRVDEKLIDQLASSEFIDSAANVVFIGGTGTGKTHLATALAIKAITQHGKRVRFFSTVELANSLELEKAAGKQGKLAYSLMHVDLVVLDELGYLPFPSGRRRFAVPLAVEALRAQQRHHHDQSHFRRVAGSLWRRKADHSTARSADASLSHRRNRQRVIPLPAEQPDGEGPSEVAGVEQAGEAS